VPDSGSSATSNNMKFSTTGNLLETSKKGHTIQSCLVIGKLLLVADTRAEKAYMKMHLCIGPVIRQLQCTT